MAHFRVLQLNIWLMDFLFYSASRGNRERVDNFFKSVAQERYELISLCEIWNENYRNFFRLQFEKLGYTVFTTKKPFFTFGDGLLIASLLPIHNFTVSPPFTQKTNLPEYFAQKRAFELEVEVQPGKIFQWVTTHTGAVDYDSKKDRFDEGQLSRLADQLKEVFEFVCERRRHKPEMPLILTGDLNFHHAKYAAKGSYTEEQSVLFSNWMRLWESSGLNLKDAQASVKTHHHDEDAHSTFSLKNPWRSLGYHAHLPSETVDYVFYTDPRKRLSLLSSTLRYLGKNNPIPGSFDPCISDHYGILSEFSVDETL